MTEHKKYSKTNRQLYNVERMNGTVKFNDFVQSTNFAADVIFRPACDESHVVWEKKKK